ncbi:MAG: ATPase, T2SS/T4P/T4SS family [Candidatus Pacebacteria bacterium]|nr:ATPase, T2SS/T4P/T4SS family [Candidatus Paceibacterota bacterium]
MNLIQLLIKQKNISKQQGEQLIEEAKRLGKDQEELLIEQKVMSEDEVFNFKSRILKVPFKKVNVEGITPDVLSFIPKEAVEFYKVVPLAIDRVKNVLEVGMVYPENSQAQEALKFLARQQKLTLNVVLITFSDFKRYFEKFQAPEKEVESALEKLEQEFGSAQDKAIIEEVSEGQASERIIEEAPVIRMVAVILRQAVEGKASDIHIEPTTEDLRVRYRLDGVLYPSLVLPLKVHPAVVARIKILSRLKIDETRIPQDGRFSAKVNDKRIDFRVSTFPTTLGEKVAIRVLDSSEGLRTLENLGMVGRNYNVIMKVIKKPFGMILVTGPTGSGKTSTLYTILNLLNKDQVNIVTLEDPVEYFMSGINQSQVRPEIDYTFAKGLRQILRQDPNIIMVGEIRDEETADLAVNAALTGHLVLSTLHTNNAVGVVPRLLDMNVKPFLIPPTLTAALSQRLVRVLCSECKIKVELDSKTKSYLSEKIKNFPLETKSHLNLKGEPVVFGPKGCKKCNSTGYLGRIGIFEVFEMTEQLGEIIAKDPAEKAILQEARRQGMLTMEEDGIIKVLQGITSLQEIMRASREG